MTTTNSIPQPGVQVIQEFRATTPTIITPTLQPVIIGPCMQVVELLTTSASGSSSLNSDALIDLPAFFVAKAATGSPAKYTGLNGLAFVFSANLIPSVTVTFADVGAVGLTPATIVSQINARLAAISVTAVVAEVVGTDTWQLRTIGLGDTQQLRIETGTHATVLSAFGIGVGRTYVGISGYNQYRISIPQSSFPDPRGNMAELSIVTASTRAFLSLNSGASFMEASKTQAFCRSGEVNDAAVLTGTVDIPGVLLKGAFKDKTFIIQVGPAGLDQTITTNVGGAWGVDGDAMVPADLLTDLSALVGATPTISSGNKLVITSTGLGYANAYLKMKTCDLNAVVGIVASTEDYGESIRAIDDGDGNSVTNLIQFPLESFTAAPTAAVITASAGPTVPLTVNTTLILSDGGPPQTIVFTAAASIGAIVSEINAVVAPAVGGKITASDAAGSLRLTHSDTGTDSVIKILGGTALAKLDPGMTPTLVAGTYRCSVVSKPEVGDELYVDGTFYANIMQVAPGSVVDTLKIDRYVTISSNVGRYFYIIAKNLPSSDVSRPDPEMAVATNGTVTLKQEFVRDASGNLVTMSLASPLYITYSALRLDVSPLASDPGLLVIDDVTQLESELAPISTDNPLALGMYFAMLNAPSIQIQGLGVDEITTDMPEGTIEAYTRAAEFIEAKEVYGIAPMTHDLTVSQVFATHVGVMSAPENKGERVAIINPETPTRALDTLVASGTDGNSVAGGMTFDTGIPNLTTLITNAGVSPVGTIPTTEGLFLDIASDSKHYSIASVSGSQVTIRITFSTGDNDDAFYSTTDLDTSPLPTLLVHETFSVKVRGAELVTSSGDPDLAGIATAVAGLGQTFANRRVWVVFPDQTAAVLDGVEQLIPGYYLSAGIAGMIGQYAPSQSFTNFPMTGYTRVIGSNDRFSSSQLDQIAGGGVWIVVQEAPGGALTSRMALTSDVSNINMRSDNVVKAIDFTAKFLRTGLRNFIGRFNITQGLLDSLGTIIQGMGVFLVETSVLGGFFLNNIVQDEDQPDTVLVDSTLDVLYAFNYLRLTLIV